MEKAKKWLKKNFTIRLAWKGILTLALILTLIFIFSQKQAMYDDAIFIGTTEAERITGKEAKALHKHPEDARDNLGLYQARLGTAESIPMDGDVTVDQEFVACEPHISNVKIFFVNPAKASTKGSISVSLIDKDDRVVASTGLDASKIANEGLTGFSFIGNTEAMNQDMIVSRIASKKNTEALSIKKGAKYIIRIESQGIKSQEGFGLALMKDEGDSPGSISVSSKNNNSAAAYDVTGSYAYMGIVYSRFAAKVFAVFIIASLLAIVFMFVPWRKVSKLLAPKFRAKGMKPVDLERMWLILMFIATPAYNYFLLSKIAGQSTVDSIMAFFSLAGVLNLMIIGLFWWSFYVITNRMNAAIVLTTLLCSFFGFVNYALLLFRDSPLIATDLYNVGTAMQVSSTYQLTFSKSAVWAVLLAAVWICIALSLRDGRGLSLKLRGAALAAAAVWMVVFYTVLFASSIISDNRIEVSSFRPKGNYADNGYMLSFWVTVGMAIVQKPDGYSVEAVSKIMESYASDEAAEIREVSERDPNIIVIMNEAYSDLRAIGDFETNKEYMPFYNSLEENTLKGTLHPSIFGGNTACSEFEYLTGFTMAFLPYHSVPYTTHLRHETPSLAWELAREGYDGIAAFHPGMRSSYNRQNAYPLLGFEKHLALEDLEDPELLRTYVSDEQDYSIIRDEYGEHLSGKGAKKPFFLFNVTIQNHSAFTLATGLVDAGISITDDALAKEEVTQYLNLIKKSDEALENLVNYFKDVKEPTVIVLFGDHQPRVENSFYEELEGRNDYDSPLEKSEHRYRVPFMIWANYDIKEEKDIDISANFASAYLLQKLGANMTGYQKYLMELHKTLPVISDIALMDTNGDFFNPDEPDKYRDIIEEYRMIQYNGFIDNDNRIDDFFSLKEEK